MKHRHKVKPIPNRTTSRLLAKLKYLEFWPPQMRPLPKLRAEINAIKAELNRRQARL